ncbi:MAG: prepilin-type N-terminal cleavage/methylation domain-containing protein [Myxococcaceae bacterium]|nr:prepilin-type N-terminal cleavage/methylation domain-containing protein [Myxococcaceae bacterium]
MKTQKKKGFTLIELMIVVAIIGILAAIAIPNFIKFQARSKQGEAKANLKSLFTAQKSFYQEKDRYSESIVEIGWAPERGNRYAYRNGTSDSWRDLSSQTVVKTNTDNAIGIDKFKFPDVQTTNPAADKLASLPVAGVTGDCPQCEFAGNAVGNIDNETTEFDQWWIGSTDQTASGACGNTDTAAPAGIPYNTNNDVECDG